MTWILQTQLVMVGGVIWKIIFWWSLLTAAVAAWGPVFKWPSGIVIRSTTDGRPYFYHQHADTWGLLANDPLYSFPTETRQARADGKNTKFHQQTLACSSFTTTTCETFIWQFNASWNSSVMSFCSPSFFKVSKLSMKYWREKNSCQPKEREDV